MSLVRLHPVSVSHFTGKSDYDSTDAFVADLASRIIGRVQVTTDGWPAYPDTIHAVTLFVATYASARGGID
jgi:hypothetical protein